MIMAASSYSACVNLVPNAKIDGRMMEVNSHRQ